MSAFVPAVVALIDQVGYVRCLDCGPDRWPILELVEANNCAIEGDSCDTCGKDLTPLYDPSNLVRPHERTVCSSCPGCIDPRCGHHWGCGCILDRQGR